MHKKALTVAIAGALAAPMAAQAVDFTISGQVSRTMFINDSDASTNAEIRDNNGATRVRANGSSELDDGSTLGIQFEYAVDAGVTLRHANVQYRGVFGAMTFGQGSEAGDGSAALGPGVTGIGAGQDGLSAAVKGYFGSLDGGGRTNMVRYDTPTIGPVRGAVSLGNNDSVSALAALSTEFGGNGFGAQVGWGKSDHAVTGTVQESVSASFNIGLASGISFGGAWGKGTDHVFGGMAATTRDAMLMVTTDEGHTGIFRIKDPSDTADWDPGTTGNQALVTALSDNFGVRAEDTTLAEDTAAQAKPADIAALRAILAQDATSRYALNEDELAELQMLLYANGCDSVDGAEASCENLHVDALQRDMMMEERAYKETVPAVPSVMSDPSYVRLGIGYTFGTTTVAASWYNSEDFQMDGTEGTAMGIGVSHGLAKVGATVHASVQNYEVEMPDGTENDETVIQIGTLVTF